VALRARRFVAPLAIAVLLANAAVARADDPPPAAPAAPPAAASPAAPPAAAPPTAVLPPALRTPITTPAPAAPMPDGVRVGIGDQKPDMFSDPRFVALGIRYARIAIGWDALTSAWQVQQLDTWLADAHALGIQPLITFGHSRLNRRSLPTPERLKYEFRRLRARYPWVNTYATWNEANHCGEMLCHKPELAAAYYHALRAECPSCTILAPEVLDMPDVTTWIRAFRKKLGYTPKLWGMHNYLEANRFKMTRLRAVLKALPGANVWLTETGGLVRRNNGSTTDIPEGATHAAEVARYLFDRVLPDNPRIKAIYLYHWNAGPLDSTWDSGLITPNGRERSALLVLQRVLRFGLRPGASFRSPPK
jgi:hypothetical protein